MSAEPWSWQCSKCERLIHNRDVVDARDGSRWHWDGIKRDWCGPVKKAELRCESL